MTDLNLLPPEYRPRSPVNLRNLLLIVLSLGLAFSLVSITMSLISKSQGYTALLTELNAQMIPYQRQYRDIQMAQEKLKTLEERLPLIETLISQRILWSERLKYLHKTLPRDGIWFEEISVVVPKKEIPQRTNRTGTTTDSRIIPVAELPWLKIGAWAKDVESMTNWLASMDEIPGFEPPVLVSAQENDAGDTEGRPKLIFFEVQLHLKEMTHQTAQAGNPLWQTGL